MVPGSKVNCPDDNTAILVARGASWPTTRSGANGSQWLLTWLPNRATWCAPCHPAIPSHARILGSNGGWSAVGGTFAAPLVGVVGTSDEGFRGTGADIECLFLNSSQPRQQTLESEQEILALKH